VAYCGADDDCPGSKIIEIGKAPIKFLFTMRSQDAAGGHDFDILWQLKDATSGQVVWEHPSSAKVVYVPEQIIGTVYTKLPPALAAIKPGQYNFIVSIISADGTIDDEKSVSLNAKAPDTMSIEDMVAAGAWGDCITMGTGVDHGAYDCALSVLGSTSRNSSTQGAFLNLSACLSSKRSATIFGHGGPGMICTESGDHCGGSGDDFISATNGAQWLRYAANIKNKATTLMLAGCSVGDTDAGAKLLQKMAIAVNATVMAPTGLIRCSKREHRMWIEGVWRSASPNSPPSPVTVESRVVAADSNAVLYINGTKRALPRSTLRPINLLLTRDNQMVPASTPSAADFAAHVDFANPEITDGVPLARVTGVFTMEVAIGSDASVTKRYTLLADTVLQDQEAPEYYYYLDTSLRDTLVSITNRP
jgi:hypothetical protein